MSSLHGGLGLRECVAEVEVGEGMEDEGGWVGGIGDCAI